jgi:hypothetical protein
MTGMGIEFSQELNEAIWYAWQGEEEGGAVV